MGPARRFCISQPRRHSADVMRDERGDTSHQMQIHTKHVRCRSAESRTAKQEHVLRDMGGIACNGASSDGMVDAVSITLSPATHHPHPSAITPHTSRLTPRPSRLMAGVQHHDGRATSCTPHLVAPLQCHTAEIQPSITLHS